MNFESSSVAQPNLDKMPVWFDNSGTDVDVVTSTRVRLARNLAHQRFPSRASLFERSAVFGDVANAVCQSAQSRISPFTVVNFSGIKRTRMQLYVEQRLGSPGLLSTEGDRGIAFDAERRMAVIINEEDHIRMQHIGSGMQPQALYAALDLFDDSLGEALPFAYDAGKGYLTSCPTNMGTGLRVSFLVHLPGLVLTKSIDQVISAATQLGISARGFFGEHSDMVGNFFQLSNSGALGQSEVGFIDSTAATIQKIVGFEREARARIVSDASLELTDKIFRAYGVLLHARTLTLHEFFNLTSALRLGIHTGLFDKLTIEQVNRLTLFALPAHIQVIGDRVMNEDEISVARADMVRKFLA